MATVLAAPFVAGYIHLNSKVTHRAFELAELPNNGFEMERASSGRQYSCCTDRHSNRLQALSFATEAQMEKTKIVSRNEYAIRDMRLSNEPFQHVQILEHIRGNKWKARWIDPNPGLVDYVESGQIIAPWKERQTFLKDEQNAERLVEHNRHCGYKGSSPIVKAVTQVFESCGEEVDFSQGVLSGTPELIGRIRIRAGHRGESALALSYLDRHGRLHWPFDAAVDLAMKFCSKEPATVLVSIEATERQWRDRASRPGEDYIIPLLNEHRASWALIRQWTGHDPAIAAREESIQKLQRLLWDAIYALQKAGAEREAARFRRALED